MNHSSQKNIFIDFHYLKNLNKGFGQFSLHLGKKMAEQPLNGLDLTYYSPFKFKNSFGKKIKHKTSFDFHRYFSFKKEYDVWHSVTHLSKVKPHESNNSKLLFTIHDALFTLFDRPHHQIKDRVDSLQSKINAATGLVYISEFTKNNIQEKFDIPDHVKQYVIYNGNPCEGLDKIKNEKYNFPYLLSIGEFRGYKNQESLIPMLRFLDSDIKLIFVGRCSKKQKEKIEALAQKYQVSNRIIIKGTVSEKEKITLYSNAAALVHPSLAEGFGLPVVEAMTFGVPVIISNKTSLPEVGGNAANYWEHYDAEYMAKIVQKTLEDFESNPEKKSLELKAQAATFSWEKAAKQYIDVYKEL